MAKGKNVEIGLVQQIQIGLNQSALDEWVEFRRKYSKKPMSQPAVDKVINKMLKWSEPDQQRIVDEAIEHEWTGLHWVDPPKKRSSKDTSIEEDLTSRDWAK